MKWCDLYHVCEQRPCFCIQDGTSTTDLLPLTLFEVLIKPAATRGTGIRKTGEGRGNAKALSNCWPWTFGYSNKERSFGEHQNQQAISRHLFASERQLRIGGHYHCLNTNSTSYISNVMSCVSGRISNLFNRDLAYSWLRPVPSLSHLPAYRFTGLTSEGHLLSFYLTHIKYCSSVNTEK